MELLVNVGHGEYLPLAQDGLTAELVWDPYDEANLEHTDSEEQAKARYREVTGLEPDPAWNLTWQSLQRWTGDAVALSAALHSLVDKLEAPPSGDDDTYDYWPSGVRLALQVAEALDAQLGGERRAEVVAKVLAVIDGMALTPDNVHLGDLAEEEDGEDPEATSGPAEEDGTELAPLERGE
jgi:hypothetical protein